jgi:hypothetical protein
MASTHDEPSQRGALRGCRPLDAPLPGERRLLSVVDGVRRQEQRGGWQRLLRRAVPGLLLQRDGHPRGQLAGDGHDAPSVQGKYLRQGSLRVQPVRERAEGLLGAGKTVDTSKTAVTQFAANEGKLSQITRKYIQNRRQINGGGTILSCGSEASTGGMTGMGQALKTGSKQRPRVPPKFLGKTVSY